jgi:hypothetical protein
MAVGAADRPNAEEPCAIAFPVARKTSSDAGPEIQYARLPRASPKAILKEMNVVFGAGLRAMIIWQAIPRNVD